MKLDKVRKSWIRGLDCEDKCHTVAHTALQFSYLSGEVYKSENRCKYYLYLAILLTGEFRIDFRTLRISNTYRFFFPAFVRNKLVWRYFTPTGSMSTTLITWSKIYLCAIRTRRKTGNSPWSRSLWAIREVMHQVGENTAIRTKARLDVSAWMQAVPSRPSFLRLTSAENWQGGTCLWQKPEVMTPTLPEIIKETRCNLCAARYSTSELTTWVSLTSSLSRDSFCNRTKFLSIRTTYKYDVQYYKCVVCSMATLCMMRSKGVDHLNLFLYMVLLVYNIYLLCDSIWFLKINSTKFIAPVTGRFNFETRRSLPNHYRCAHTRTSAYRFSRFRDTTPRRFVRGAVSASIE